MAKPNFKKEKIDVNNLEQHVKDKDKQERIKDQYAKVKHLLKLDIETVEIGEAIGYQVTAQTTIRTRFGQPPMLIINPDLEAALTDIETLERLGAE